MEDNLDRVTTNRANLPLWISSSASHLMLEISTLNKNKENAFEVSKSVEIKKLEIQTLEEAHKDLEICEAEVFSNGFFRKIQKYL